MNYVQNQTPSQSQLKSMNVNQGGMQTISGFEMKHNSLPVLNNAGSIDSQNMQA